jgi:hypothetical protein
MTVRELLLFIEIRKRFTTAERLNRISNSQAFRDLKFMSGSTWNVIPWSVRYPASRLPADAVVESPANEDGKS